MRKNIFSFGITEARLIGFATEKDHQEGIEQAFEAASQPKRPLTLADYRKTTDIISRQGALDVQMAAPTWTERINRWMLSKAGGVIKIDLYDAEHKTLSDQIDLNVKQRLNASQEQIELNKTKALSRIVDRARNSKNSHAFLNEKAEVCTQLIQELQQKKKLLEEHQQLAGNVRKIEKLDIKIGQLEKIEGDVKAKIESTEQLDVAQNIEEADGYFREIFSLYRPESLFQLTGLLQSYALTGENSAKAKPFLTELRKIAEKMFPDRADSAKRKKQLERMLQVARHLLGEGKWRSILRHSLFEGIPGVSAAALTSATIGGTFATGGVGLLAAGLGYTALGIRNWYKHGRRGLNRKQWYQEQVATYYTSAPTKALKQVSDMLEIPKMSDRLKKIESLPSGTRFQILLDGNVLDLTITSKRATLLFATDAKGQRYSFDTAGFNGKYFFSHQSGSSTTIVHKELKAPVDQLFSAA